MPSPQKALIENIQQIVVDDSATCALDEGGAVFCWGSRVSPNEKYLSVPKRLEGFPLIAAIGSGFATFLVSTGGTVFHRFDLKSLSVLRDKVFYLPVEGQADCLLSVGGLLACGSIGEPYFDAVTAVPAGLIQIAGNPDPFGVGVGLYPDGSVWCVNANYCDLVFRDRDVFLSDESYYLTAAPPAKYVSLGCLIGTDGRVYCWGENGFGQLGTGKTAWFDGTFRPVLHIENAVKVQTNDALHRCALTETKELWCWGGNQVGQIGNGKRLLDKNCRPYVREGEFQTEIVTYNCPGEYEPVLVLEGVRDFALDRYHTCAVLEDGQVMCWGDQRNGKLGNGVNVE